MSKTNPLWLDKYEAAQELSIFPEFKREMERLGFSLDEIFDHWDSAEESRREKEIP